MTEDQAKKLNDLHAFWFETPPGLPNTPTRAQQLEELLKAYRSGSWLARLLIYLSGLAGAVLVLLQFRWGGE